MNYQHKVYGEASKIHNERLEACQMLSLHYYGCAK